MGTSLTRKSPASALVWALLWIAPVEQSVGFVPATNRNGPPHPSSSRPETTLHSSRNGETRGAALLLDGVDVYRGPSPILRDISWRVEPRTKWALVGENGAGKSTLLKAIVGDIPYDGSIAVGAKNEEIGYLQQTAVAGSTRTIYEEAASGMQAINHARESMERAAEQGDLDALDRATSRFEALGGYQQEQKVSSVLKGLGFSDFNKRCDELSGGWQMRVSFAKVLLSEPSLCLLDEPSNHLDSAAKKWLARYLATYDGAGSMVLVTHDVDLLQSMDHIAEIVAGAGSLQVYKSCTYQQYLQLKEERATAAVAEFKRNSEKAAKLQAFVDRFGASATKASAAQSRVKQIERMEREGLLDAPAQALIAQQFKPILDLPTPPTAIGESLLALHSGEIGYSDDAPLVSNVNLDIRRGMKILVRGPNGAGKSTVLHTLRGSVPLLSGTRKENECLRLGVFTQDLAQELDPESRAVDLVVAYAREGKHGDIFVSEEAARGAMGKLGLRGEKALRRIQELSGGEKARVALAMFSLKPSNLYLLDECSNHLDVACVEALSEELSEWGGDKGALLVISHDKSFCDRIDFTHVAMVKDGKLTLEQREVRASDWVIETLDGGNAASSEGGDKDGEQSSSSSHDAAATVDPKLRKKAYNAPKRIAKLEKLIEEAESHVAELDDEMMSVGTDAAKLMDLMKKKEEIEAKVVTYMDEWEELEALLDMVGTQ